MKYLLTYLFYGAAFVITSLHLSVAVAGDLTAIQRQVFDTEKAFSQTMVQRNHAAFSSFLSEEAVFFSGARVMRGKQEVEKEWKRFYEGSEAPFSWEPETVEVLASGTLAISSGPVKDASGKHFANYTSIWRLEAPNTWRIIFDKGNEVCNCKKAEN
jgi:ketosteroid isomerase-like protein